MSIELEQMELGELTQLFESVECELAKRRKQRELHGKLLNVLEKAEQNGYHFVLDNGRDLNYAFASGEIGLQEQE